MSLISKSYGFILLWSACLLTLSGCSLFSGGNTSDAMSTQEPVREMGMETDVSSMGMHTGLAPRHFPGNVVSYDDLIAKCSARGMRKSKEMAQMDSGSSAAAKMELSEEQVMSMDSDTMKSTMAEADMKMESMSMQGTMKPGTGGTCLEGYLFFPESGVYHLAINSAGAVFLKIGRRPYIRSNGKAGEQKSHAVSISIAEAGWRALSLGLEQQGKKGTNVFFFWKKPTDVGYGLVPAENLSTKG